MRRIGVIGDGDCSEAVKRLAGEVGREIARRKGILICGGLGGVMEAAARGAKEEGGITIGILPGEKPSGANPFIDIPIVTGLREARNIIVVRSSEAIIAIHGKYGTLSEIAFALKFKIPIVGLSTWEVSPDIVAASTAVEAVEKAFRLIEKAKG